MITQTVSITKTGDPWPSPWQAREEIVSSLTGAAALSAFINENMLSVALNISSDAMTVTIIREWSDSDWATYDSMPEKLQAEQAINDLGWTVTETTS
jgi:hypothetical protein